MSKSFTEITGENDNLLIVDSLNLAFRWKTSDNATDMYEDYLSTINSLKRSYKAKYVVLATDKGSSSYRKEIYPLYKQNRKDKYANETDADRARFELFFSEYNIALQYIRDNTDYPVIQFEATEADDIAAYIVQIAGEFNIKDTWLISTDRDWDLLLNDTTHRFSYVTRKEYTLNNWNEHYEYPHSDYLSIKCLMGDTGDNIMGVPSVGPKRAAALVGQYGDALELANALPINSHLAYIKSLNGCKDTIMLNYRLMDLVSFCEDALGKESIATINEILKGYICCTR